MPLRICLSADLYPREYLPDLTTSARRDAIDSVDLAALDFLVGAIADVGDGCLRTAWSLLLRILRVVDKLASCAIGFGLRWALTPDWGQTNRAKGMVRWRALRDVRIPNCQYVFIPGVPLSVRPLSLLLTPPRPLSSGLTDRCTDYS